MSATLTLDRRRFLGRMTLTVGGVACASLLPASLLQAALPWRAFPSCVNQDPCGDWQLDDMCLAYPGYSFHREPTTAHQAQQAVMIDPVDRMWVG